MGKNGERKDSRNNFGGNSRRLEMTYHVTYWRRLKEPRSVDSRFSTLLFQELLIIES